MSAKLPFYPLAAALVLASCPRLHAENANAVALLTAVDLGGANQSTVKWLEVGGANPGRLPSTGAGTLTIGAPGFQASAGIYSFSTPYTVTLATASPGFAVKNVVLQAIGMTVSGETIGGETVDRSPEYHLTFNGGPVLSYTHEGSEGTLIGTLSATAHGTLGGPLHDPGTFIEGDYYTFTWQWDLSALPHNVTGISIQLPIEVHSSTVGFQIDLGDAYAPLFEAPLTALQQWRQTHFSTSANTGDAADDADPDGDGVPNLLEYALGRLPNVNDSAAPAALALNPAGTHLTLGFDRIADTGLTYIVEAKNNLAAAEWTDITPAWLATAPAGPVLVEDPQALSASPRRFLRLRVEAN